MSYQETSTGMEFYQSPQELARDSAKQLPECHDDNLSNIMYAPSVFALTIAGTVVVFVVADWWKVKHQPRVQEVTMEPPVYAAMNMVVHEVNRV